MTVGVTLLMSTGDPDPTWALNDEQQQTFATMLADSPVPNTTLAAPGRRTGYGGIMVRTGDGERWVVHRGWIRGGVVTRTDEGRVLEQWLLETGRGTLAPKLMSDLAQRIAPPA